MHSVKILPVCINMLVSVLCPGYDEVGTLTPTLDDVKLTSSTILLETLLLNVLLNITETDSL